MDGVAPEPEQHRGLPKETVEKIQRLFEEGWTHREIVKMLGVSRPTVAKYTEGLASGRPPKGAGRIQALEKILGQVQGKVAQLTQLQKELQDLQEKLQGQLERANDHCNAALAEIEKYRAE